jgi:hypothetical protein
VAPANIAWEIGWVVNPGNRTQAWIGWLAQTGFWDWLVERADWSTRLANRLEELVGRTPWAPNNIALSR